jgi:hypothetical protein
MERLIHTLTWPVVVAFAFWAGRYVQKLEARVLTAERNVKNLIERHMPAVHRALGDIAGALDALKHVLIMRRSKRESKKS